MQELCLPFPYPTPPQLFKEDIKKGCSKKALAAQHVDHMSTYIDEVRTRGLWGLRAQGLKGLRA